MLSKRVIPCLDVRAGRLTKGIRFAGNEDIGDPVESARRYYEEGADEIVFYDITASAEERGIFLDVVERVAEQIFIPFCVGGGISSVADMRAVLVAGPGVLTEDGSAVADLSKAERREVTLDIDCTGTVDLRFRDEAGNAVLEVEALPGQAVSLEDLERGQPYTVEMRGEPFIYLVFR